LLIKSENDEQNDFENFTQSRLLVPLLCITKHLNNDLTTTTGSYAILNIQISVGYFCERTVA